MVDTLDRSDQDNDASITNLSKRGRVWLLAIVHFLLIPVTLYGIGFWLPQMITSFTSITSKASVTRASDSLATE